MRVYIQWTRADPRGWEPLDITKDADWRRLPSKAVPTGGEVIDDAPGWLWDLEVGGVHGLGSIDHTAVQVIPGGGLRVTRWEDDPEDFGDWRRAEVWEFLPPAHDVRVGRVQPRSRLMAEYRTDGRFREPSSEHHAWSAFVPPPANMTRHGINVPDALATLHRERRGEPHSWQDWIES